MSVRQLKGICIIDGRACIVLSMEVDQSSTKQADTLHAEIAIDANPGVAALASAAPDLIVTGSVEAAQGSGLLFVGTSDNITIDFTRRILKVSARDKTKGPIGKTTTEDFRNRTPSEIVAEIAGRHGLAPVIDGISDMAGRQQSKEDYVHLTHHISEWSLVQHLADREGKVAFVRENKLYFVEIDAAIFGSISVVYKPPSPSGHATSNVIELTCYRNFEAGKKKKLSVRSWNVKKKRAFVGTDAGGSGGSMTEFDYSHPQLNQQQCDKIAKKRLREILRQEMNVEATLVGSAALAPPKMLHLSGTQTAFDQTYFIERAQHRIGKGYTTRVTSKNSKGGR